MVIGIEPLKVDADRFVPYWAENLGWLGQTDPVLVSNDTQFQLTLMYAHAVVVPIYLGDSLKGVGTAEWMTFDPETGKGSRHPQTLEETLANVKHNLVELAELRPLVEIGAVYLDERNSWLGANTPSILSGELRGALLRDDNLGPDGPRWFPFGLDWTGFPQKGRLVEGEYGAYDAYLNACIWELDKMFGASANGAGDVLFRYPLVEQLFRYQFGDRQGVSPRALEPLYAFVVPQGVPARLADIARVIADSSTLNEWRTELTAALVAVNALTDEDRWSDDARTIFADQLQPYRARLERVSKSTSAVASVKAAASGLAWSGLGAGVAAAAGSDPRIGLGSAALTKVSQTGLQWASTHKRRRVGKAVLALTAALIPASP